MYIDKLYGTVNDEYNNIYRSAIDANVKTNTYIDSDKEINDQHPKFKIGEIVRISKYKNIFVKNMLCFKSVWRIICD